MMSFALVAGLAIITSSNKYFLAASTMYLGVILAFHLFHKIRKAYRTSIFESLAGHVRSFRSKIEGGEVIQLDIDVDKSSDPSEITIEQFTPKSLSSAYMCNQFFEYLADKLNQLAKSRKVDLYLILSLAYTFLLTAVVFASVYYGLHRIDPNSFKPESVNFWEFAKFSFGVLTCSDFSSITPVSLPAKILHFFEVLCQLLIVIILVFNVLTVARERYKEGINIFISELKSTSQSAQLLIEQTCRKTIYDVELYLIETKQKTAVIAMRKLRGLPELKAVDPDSAEKPKAATKTKLHQKHKAKGPTQSNKKQRRKKKRTSRGKAGRGRN